MATNQHTTELRELDINALVDRLTEAKKEHFNLRFQHVTGQLDNTSRARRGAPPDRPHQHVLRQREIAAPSRRSMATKPRADGERDEARLMRRGETAETVRRPRAATGRRRPAPPARCARASSCPTRWTRPPSSP